MHMCACICASNTFQRWHSVLCSWPNYSLYNQSLSTHREFQKCVNENSLVEEYLASFKKKKTQTLWAASVQRREGLISNVLLLPFTYISTDLQSHIEIREYQISVANTYWDFTIL